MAACSTETPMHDDPYGYGYSSQDEDDSAFMAQQPRRVARRKPSRRASCCSSVDYRSVLQPGATASVVSDESSTILHYPIAKYASPHSPTSVASANEFFAADNNPDYMLKVPHRAAAAAAAAASGGGYGYDDDMDDDEVSCLTMHTNVTAEEKKMPARRGKKKPAMHHPHHHHHHNLTNDDFVSTTTNHTSSAVLMEELPPPHRGQQDPHAAPHHGEVWPGVYEPLRSAQETWGAIENDFFVPSICVTCHTHMFCIQDSRFVLCPQCRVVSPLHQEAPPPNYCGTTAHHARGHQHQQQQQQQVRGIGLGFTYDQLCDWQGDILRQRQGRGRRGRRMSAVW